MEQMEEIYRDESLKTVLKAVEDHIDSEQIINEPLLTRVFHDAEHLFKLLTQMLLDHFASFGCQPR